MPHISASEALSHITVLDLTRVRSGPTAVRQLADWGANVIKIEPPESIEPDGSLGASRDTADFQNLHRNKRSLTLNLKDKKLLAVSGIGNPENFFKILISVSTIYILGLIWLGSLIGWDKPIFELGAKPFLLAELFKILILTFLASKLVKFRKSI